MKRWHTYNKGKTTTERGYGHSWRKARELALDRDGYLCQQCKERHIVKAATEVDHILEKAYGGTDDIDNLRSLCRQCHKDKTNKKKTAPCDVSGIPLDPNHRWNYQDC